MALLPMLGSLSTFPTSPVSYTSRFHFHFIFVVVFFLYNSHYTPVHNVLPFLLVVFSNFHPHSGHLHTYNLMQTFFHFTFPP